MAQSKEVQLTLLPAIHIQARGNKYTLDPATSSAVVQVPFMLIQCSCIADLAPLCFQTTKASSEQESDLRAAIGHVLPDGWLLDKKVTPQSCVCSTGWTPCTSAKSTAFLLLYEGGCVWPDPVAEGSAGGEVLADALLVVQIEPIKALAASRRGKTWKAQSVGRSRRRSSDA